MKEENITKIVSEQRTNKERINDIRDYLDNIGVDREKIEAFTRLIDSKLQYIKSPLTNKILGESQIKPSDSITLWDIQHDIGEYIILDYAISDYLNDIKDKLTKIFNILNDID